MNRSLWLRLALPVISCVLSACAGGPLSWPGPEAVQSRAGLPERVEPVPADLRLAPADTIAGDGCRNPLLDPAGGTRLRLLRSMGGEGDYEAPAGSYGLTEDQVIRIRCNTGLVLGTVHR